MMLHVDGDPSAECESSARINDVKFYLGGSFVSDSFCIKMDGPVPSSTNLQGKGPDVQDFIGILLLLIINSTISFVEENNAGNANSTISFVEENNAGNAAAALMARLAPKAKILRDGKWNEEDAAELVPGDIVSIKLGDIIPADARLLEGDPLKIDQLGFMLLTVLWKFDFPP